METPAMSSPVVEGQGATPAPPQVSAPETQVPGQTQETSHAQVESATQTSSQEPPQKASEFETARQIKRLAKQMQSIQQALERSSQPGSSQGVPQTPAPARTPITQQELLADPLATINRILDERDQRLMGEIPKTLTAREQQMAMERNIQEGWKIIRSNEGFKRDPEGEDKINEILLEEDENGNSLQKYSTFNPLHAAKLAMETYKQRYGAKTNQPAPATKAQMISTATATYSGGGKMDVGQEAIKLQREAMDNPDLMRDPNWIARLNAVKGQFNQAKFGQPNPLA